MSRVLFLLKRRETPIQPPPGVAPNHIGLSTGLYNSAKFMNDMLLKNGIQSCLEVVQDYNKIDREVRLHQPTHAILEAIWVTPAKITELQRLHPRVKWVIRVHSEMPFLAGESNALDWIADYSACKNVVIAMNAPRIFKEISLYLKIRNSWTDEQTQSKCIYLPNYYPQQFSKTAKIDYKKDTIDIGCFGAIRPLKNQVLQAVAAIGFADQLGKKLRFHINAGRIEMNGNAAIKSLKSIFQQIHSSGHQLINHQWRPRNEFLKLCAEMDLGLQVSFSETFNIVGADVISQGVPLIATATEIPWAVHAFCAEPTNHDDIIAKMKFAYNYPKINVLANQWSLKHYTNKTEKIWTKYFS